MGEPWSRYRENLKGDIRVEAKHESEAPVVLVVDDDPVNLMLICQTMTDEGYSTVEADCGEAALKAFTECRYDLVLLDVIMPGIDGFETCRKLRALPGGARVPVLIITGLDDEQSINRAFDVGATDFITKPITWPLLGHRMRYLLRASESMRDLAQSRERLANAQRIAKMGSWEFDLLHGETMCSEEVFRILEIAVGEAAGEAAPSYEAFIGSVHPDDREQVDRVCRHALRNSEPCEIEHRLLMPDARVKWVKLRGRAGDGDDAQNHLFIVTIQDITESKCAKDEKRILEERLQHADKMEAIGTLAGGIAHDFNNMLLGIQGYATMTLVNLNQDDPNYERIKRIEQLVQSGSELTNQLLGFARGGRYEVKPTNMNDILEMSSSMFGRTKKEITIDKKYERDLCVVEVDRGQMEQVFLNLYVNAWQAMPKGGQIYLATQNILLDDDQKLPDPVKPGKYVKIIITDNGIGMDEKTRERIFDPFFTTKKMGRGTGLGLAMVYGIIKNHGGMINVYSELGHGTTFNIYLPASEKEVVKEEMATGGIARGRETILVVDDEKMISEVSKELLESMGYRVYVAGSGQEALAVYMEKRNQIDLVILDMIMPGISGGETFDRLREINSKIKVLLSSGYSLDGEARTIIERGCDGFLQKPYQMKRLASKIREILDV
jgi:CheY-like chemotaxis protein